MRLSYFALIVTISFGCEPPNTVSKSDYEYYDVTGFAAELIANQSTASKSAVKTVDINGEFETKTIEQPDSSFWAIELSGLLSIDLNKPSLFDAYSVQDRQQDDSSNLLFDAYYAKNPESTEVKSINIYYVEEKQEVRKIEFKAGNTNLLLKESQNFSIWINRYNDKLLIDSVKTTVKSQQLGGKANQYIISTVVN